MQKLTKQEQKIVTQKWVIQILLVLRDNKKHSYRSIKKYFNIPNSSLAVRLNDLTKYKFIHKYIYGNASSLHYTDYKISAIGLNYLNTIVPKSLQCRYM